MNSSQVKVSVLMPVYNGAGYLREAMDSIFAQTYTDFEFLVVNDGSTDSSAAILESYSDPRLRVIHKQQNQGLIATLNEGLDACSGEYIVRMDADDISLPDRIERQVAFLDERPEVGLCGSWFEDFGPGIPGRIIRYSTSDTEIRIRHLYQTHIAHPTAILRKSLLEKFNLRFDPLYVHGEDYHFWVCMSRHCKMSNLPEVLVRKRDHPANVSNRYAEIQRNTCNRVKRLQFAEMGVEIDAEEAEMYSRFANTEWNFREEEMPDLVNLLHRIESANQKSRFIDPIAFTSYLAAKWFHLCLNNAGWGRQRMSIFKSLSFRKVYPARMKSKASMLMKTLIGS